MEQTQTPNDGFILELYRHGSEVPLYVSVFDEKAEAGISDYSESKADAAIFESREALLPLASIEVESVIDDGEGEVSAFDGFRILPAAGKGTGQIVSRIELEAALQAFEQGE